MVMTGNPGVDMFVGAGTNFGGGLLDRASQELGDKIFGIPKPPDPPSGTWLGEQSKDYMDKVYPGTTVFERLGVQSPVGQVSSAGLGAGINAASGQTIANREMFNQQLMQKAQLALEKYKVDTDARLRDRQISVEESMLPSRKHQAEFGTLSSTAKSMFDKAWGIPEKVLGWSGQLGNWVRGNDKKIQQLRQDPRYPFSRKQSPYRPESRKRVHIDVKNMDR